MDVWVRWLIYLARYVVHPFPKVEENAGVGQADDMLGQIHVPSVPKVEENAGEGQADDLLGQCGCSVPQVEENPGVGQAEDLPGQLHVHCSSCSPG